MRVGAHEGFAYNSVEVGLRANGKGYEVDSNTFFLSGKVLPCSYFDRFWHTFASVVWEKNRCSVDWVTIVRFGR